MEPRRELDGLPVEVDAGLGQQSDRIEHLVQVSDRVMLAVRLRPAGNRSSRSSSVKCAATSPVFHRVDLNPY